MLRLVKDTIKQVVFLPLFIFSAAAISQPFEWSDALQLIDESGVVNVPEGYTTIKANAFKNINVKQINLPDGIHTIEYQAFYNSVSLESINIPDSVTFIGEGAFQGTRSLKSIELPTAINVIERYTFDNSGIENINFQNISSIKDYAFRGTNLQSIDLQPGTSLSNGAFNNIDTIEHLFIPSNVSLSGYYIFSGMDNLKSIHIGSNVNLANINYGFSSAQTIISESTFFCRSSSGGICVTADFIVAKGSLESTPEIAGASYVLWNNTQNTFNQVAEKVFYIAPSNRDEPVFSISQSVFCENIDTDNDGHQDCYDQFPNDPEQWYDYESSKPEPEPEPILDGDSDGILDIFDDSVYTHSDNCLEIDGAGGESSINTDGDVRNNCEDPDDDNDGLLDIYEPFFGTNPLIPDSDFDGAIDGLDAFPMDNTESLDTDSDGIGNNADTDDDNDGYTDFLDAFPTDASEWADSDLDGIGNNSDSDDDNDGVADTEDAFPHTASESLDSDSDGVGDNADAFPNDATEVADTDLDGIGNNADPDDDNDGVADADDGDPLNADIGIQPSQLISVAGNPVGVNGHSTRISLSYDTSDGNNQLPGIGFRLHYSSEMLTFVGTESAIGHDLIVNGDGPYQDDSDLDNNADTDKFILFGWASLNGNWPNVNLPASLVDVVFNVSWEAFDQASITTPINFSKVSSTEGYNFEATNYTLNVLPATWDFDGNGQADALTDGLILLRHAFGVRGASLTDSVMATDSTMASEEVQVAVEKALVIADVDGDGNVDALTDGLIVLRYMFGLTGETLMDGVVSANATRASAESVQEHIELYMPNNLLPPVQSEQIFIVGDWKLADIPEQREYVGGILSDWNASIWGYDQVLFETCVEDDIYRFGETGSFEYLINGSTYMNDEMNPLFNYGSANSYCDSPLAPWNESDIYTYSFDENNSLLTVTGYGAYIALAHVANGTDGIEHGADAPESITYSYTKILENQILLEIDAYYRFYRFTLEKVVN